MDSFIPEIIDLLAALLSRFGVPLLVIAIAQTVYVAYGWYAGGRWAVKTAASMGGFITKALQRGGFDVVLSAIWYGFMQIVFIVTSIVIGQFLLLQMSLEEGTGPSFDSEAPIASMTNALTATSYEHTETIIYVLIFLSFLPLLSAISSRKFPLVLFIAGAGLLALLPFVVAALNALTILGGAFLHVVGHAEWGTEQTIASLSFTVSVLYLVSATVLLTIGAPASKLSTAR